MRPISKKRETASCRKSPNVRRAAVRKAMLDHDISQRRAHDHLTRNECIAAKGDKIPSLSKLSNRISDCLAETLEDIGFGRQGATQRSWKFQLYPFS